MVAYIDASFLMYPDGKSHSGVIIMVGGALVNFSLKKLKCISKSPTEAELVALYDNIGLVKLIQEPLAFMVEWFYHTQ